MPPEEAMEKYIDIVSELYPSWLDGSTIVSSESFTYSIVTIFLLVAQILIIHVVCPVVGICII